MVVRFLSATIAIPIVLAFMLLGNLWFLILMIFGAAISSFEASRLLKTRGIDTNPTVSASIGSVIVALAYWSGEINISVPLVILCGSISALVLLIIYKPTNPTHTTGLLCTLLSATYVGGALFHAPLLRESIHGLEWLIFLMVTIILTDSGAYGVGKSIGKTPFFPSISPNKTLEGSIGGLILGTLGAVAVSYLIEIPNLDPVAAAGIGITLSILGQIGDLSESAIKRISGVKDSGGFMPGHGGALDRIDSIVLSLPVLYYLSYLFPKLVGT